MSCDRKILIVRAGDAWSIPFRYTVDGVPDELPDGARLDITDARGDVLLSASIGDGLTFEETTPEGGSPVKNIVRLTLDGTQTAPLAQGNRRTELRLALLVYTVADEQGSRRTIVDTDLIVKPRAVG